MTRAPRPRELESADAMGEDLGTDLSRLSAEALALATAAIESGDFAASHAKARTLNDRLDQLWPRVEIAASSERGGLERSWSDARLDLGFVLSDGELTPSIRLHRLIQDRAPS